MSSLSLLTTALVLSSAFAQDRWLNITVKEAFNLYVDGEFILAENSRNASAVDTKPLTVTDRLVAVQGINIASGCPGILVSVTEDFLLTNASSWKCSGVSDGSDWNQLGFDDSLWPPAAEVKRNDQSASSCDPTLPYIETISNNAWWIWITNTAMEVVYCRGYLAVCSSSPCVNGGTCNSNAPVLCTCPSGYTGIFCESQINACDSSPCLNGGQCQGSADAYRCFCRPGWTGTNCQTEILECSSTPCINGGTCWEFVNHYNCTCPIDYTGSRCETEIPPLTLLVTGDRGLLQLYVDGAEAVLDPGSSMNWTRPATVVVPGATRVVAVRCLNSFVSGCSGILASTAEAEGEGRAFVTDSVDWRCSSEDSSADWFQPDFDDSQWSKAIEYEGNAQGGPWTCEHRSHVPEISPDAFWIWSSNPSAPVNCRGYMVDPCDKSPCLNGGVCSSAGEEYTCTCDDIYTGANCESDFSYDFVLTADRAVLALYVEGYFRPLSASSSANWTETETVPIARSTTVLGIRATASVGESACSGLIASIADDGGGFSFATDSVRWTCSTDNSPGWYSPSYDDSHWPNAVDYGQNAPPFVGCSYRHQLQDISSDARWIYTDDQTATTVNCRGRLPPVKQTVI